MTTISQAATRFNSLKLREKVPELVKESSSELIDLNLDQLRHGQTSEGMSISPDYFVRSYADYKNSINSKPGYGVPDLYYTGSFYNSFFVKVDSVSFSFGATDDKAGRLSSKYKADGGIFGLTPESKKTYAKQVIGPLITAYITDKTGLKIG